MGTPPDWDRLPARDRQVMCPDCNRHPGNAHLHVWPDEPKDQRTTYEKVVLERIVERVTTETVTTGGDPELETERARHAIAAGRPTVTRRAGLFGRGRGR